MKKEYVKLFKDPKNLETLAKLIDEKKSYASIGRILGVDHSSVIYQARKLGIVKGKRVIIREKIVQQRLPKKPLILEDYYEDGDKIISGHSYSWYREQERLRKAKLELKNFRTLIKRHR